MEEIATIWKYFSIYFLLVDVSAFWDVGTSTVRGKSVDVGPRYCRFRWMRTESCLLRIFHPSWDWPELIFRRRLYIVAGLSHDFVNLGTATILNRRTLITSANYLDPYMDKQQELRIWALGRRGEHDTPWRYRVWRVTRITPRSLNPEHCHGPYCYHSPRHDLTIIHSYDQMYVAKTLNSINSYAFRASMPSKTSTFRKDDLWFTGSGYLNFEHIFENYKIVYTKTKKQFIVDCSKYIPKWWGKFICIINRSGLSGIQNGAGLYNNLRIHGVACFEIRYNDDRIFVFTDIRYYRDMIYYYAEIRPGEYYEYAYPQWSAKMGPVMIWKNIPYIPSWQIQDDLYPLGKK